MLHRLSLPKLTHQPSAHVPPWLDTECMEGGRRDIQQAHRDVLGQPDAPAHLPPPSDKGYEQLSLAEASVVASNTAMVRHNEDQRSLRYASVQSIEQCAHIAIRAMHGSIVCLRAPAVRVTCMVHVVEVHKHEPRRIQAAD